MEKQLNQKSLTVGILAILSVVFETAWCVVIWRFYDEVTTVAEVKKVTEFLGKLGLVTVDMFLISLVAFNLIVAWRSIGYATGKYENPTPKVLFVISLVFTGIMYFFVGFATVGVCSDAVKVGGMFSPNGIVFIAVTATAFCLQTVVTVSGFFSPEKRRKENG